MHCSCSNACLLFQYCHSCWWNLRLSRQSRPSSSTLIQKSLQLLKHVCASGRSCWWQHLWAPEDLLTCSYTLSAVIIPGPKKSERVSRPTNGSVWITEVISEDGCFVVLTGAFMTDDLKMSVMPNVCTQGERSQVLKVSVSW